MQSDSTTKTIYEDAEDRKVTGWVIFDKTPAGASISNTYDIDKNSRVITLTGNAKENGFRLGNHAGALGAWSNAKQFVLCWDMKFATAFDIYITVNTSFGQRYLAYSPLDKNLGINVKQPNFIHHGIGKTKQNGQWHTIQRNLEADLLAFEPNNTLLTVNGFFVRGSGSLDNILLESSATPTVTPALASAFLARATFGSTLNEINQLVAAGNLESWIDSQFKAPPSSHLQWIKDAATVPITDDDWNGWVLQLEAARLDAWFAIVVQGQDQLRQRVAFALSEIFVISKEGALITFPDSLTHYYDVLVNGAFGNFRDLLSNVTLHPMMGRYLTYLGNSKSDSSGHRPDENYAREIMQLFTIGLYQLEQNGELKDGVEQATYTQQDVTELARVFTGLSDDNGFFFASDGGHNHYTRTAPMVAWENYHDTDPKTVLNTALPAGQSVKQDVDQALDILFNHPNTAPFIARRLIQRLVTSNPSADYIERVANAFDNNGNGVRGDMQAVIKAILLDTEALNGSRDFPETFGKVREPLLFVSSLWRTFQAQTGQQGETPFAYQAYGFRDSGAQLQQQSPLSALTVFNFFTPDDAPVEIAKAGLVAPEMTITQTSWLPGVLMEYSHEAGEYRTDALTAALTLDDEVGLLSKGDVIGLVRHLDILLTAGKMSPELSAILQKHLAARQAVGASNNEMVRDLLALVMMSAEYAVQR